MDGEDDGMKPKRCPYCRGERIWMALSLTDHVWRYHLECAACHWCGRMAMTKKGAVIKWNLQRNYISKH